MQSVCHAFRCHANEQIQIKRYHHRKHHHHTADEDKAQPKPPVPLPSLTSFSNTNMFTKPYAAPRSPLVYALSDSYCSVSVDYTRSPSSISAEEKELEYEYDYYITNITAENNGDDIYIDVTIDLNALHVQNVSHIITESPSHESIFLERITNYAAHQERIISSVRDAPCDILCNFLPLIAVVLCQSSTRNWQLRLFQTLKQRIVTQSDLKQSLQFLLKSYPKIRTTFAHFGYTNKKTQCIEFWMNIIRKMKWKQGHEITIDPNTMIRDPIHQSRAPISQVVIRKVLNSNSKPLLIDCFVSRSMSISSSFILKYGDDLRKDCACQLVLWMNHLWKRKPTLRYKNKSIEILTYKVVPMSNKLGCIELISDCIPLRDILSLQDAVKKKPRLMDNLIVSAAGSYIASYIMGVRDRHFDNILIRTTDLQLFHIDMNYILGDTVKGIDANEFGITKRLYDFLQEDNYKEFIDLCCNAFEVLRQHKCEFIDFACLAFCHVNNDAMIRSHILKQLRISQTNAKARQWLKNTLHKAPYNVQTSLKNTLHKWRTH